MTTEELEDKWRKEAEREFPYAIKEVAEIWPKTAEMLRALVDHQREAYIAGCRSRQAEIEALKKEMSEMTNRGWYSDMNNKLFSAQERVEALTKERDESRENYESLMRSSLVVGEEYRENINALTRELEALREAAQKVCDTWAPMEHREAVDNLQRVIDEISRT